jgi:hypothetical protein
MERLGEESAGKNVENMMLDQEVRNVFESLFSERFPDTPLDSLKASHTKAPPDDPEGKPVLDDLAYSAELRDRLLDAEPINEQNLAVLASGQFSEDRVVIADAVEVESEDGEWVIMELAVAAE